MSRCCIAYWLMFLLGGPADEYPANFFILFFVANIQLRKNLEKSYGPQTDQSTISADRDFYTSRSPPHLPINS